MKHDKALKVLGITVLALLALVSIASATTITVNYPNNPAFGSGEVPLTVNFRYAVPGTSDSESLNYNWNFGDSGDGTNTDTNPSIPEPTHTYTKAGTYTVTLTVTQYGNTYLSQTITINVQKLTPTVTWNNPADIKPKTALSDIQLNAVASVPGTFVYTPSSGTVLSKGTQTLKVDFTPTDTVNYNSVSQSSTINVLSNNGNGNGKNK